VSLHQVLGGTLGPPQTPDLAVQGSDLTMAVATWFKAERVRVVVAMLPTPTDSRAGVDGISSSLLAALS